VPVVGLPREVYDDRGFMREQYKHDGDAQHGNLEFGGLLLTEILGLLSGSSTTS
jgi:hypothetical protein